MKGHISLVFLDTVVFEITISLVFLDTIVFDMHLMHLYIYTMFRIEIHMHLEKLK